MAFSDFKTFDFILNDLGLHADTKTLEQYNGLGIFKANEIES